MFIFKEEKGLRDLILGNTSVAYTVDVEEAPPSLIEVTLAKFWEDTPKTEDLFYTRSVFVSTIKNKNDDVFLPSETWAARKSPVDKACNLEHDPKQIVGHITASWAVDTDGMLMDDSLAIDELPPFFRLCNSSVIYRKLRDEEMQRKSDELVAGIVAGEIAVSMEASFRDFDYLVAKCGGEKTRVKRDESTAFLTQHLRAYGGTGRYQDWEVARILKGITFIGKGFVKNPADPSAKIFYKEDNSESTLGTVKNHNPFGVYTLQLGDKSSEVESATEKEKCEENSMSQDLEKKYEDAQKVIQELRDELAQADVQRFESQVTDLQKRISDLESSVASERERAEKAEQAKACMCEQYETLKTEKETLEARLKELEVAKRSQARYQTFIDKGFDPSEAKAKAEKLAALSDEDFTLIAGLLPDKAEKFVAPEENEEEVEAEVSDETPPVAPPVETVEITANENEANQIHETVASYYCSKFGVKREEK